MKIQKKIILIIIIAIIFIPKTVKAEDNTIETQKETFGINSLTAQKLHLPFKKVLEIL